MGIHILVLMKPLLTLIAVFFLFAPVSVFAQQINVPKDSIPGLLCKKWETAYVQIGSQQMAPNAGSAIILNFHTDHSLVLSNDNGKSTKGTWSYNESKKMVLITINGHTVQAVVDLGQTQMTTVVNPNNSTSGGAPTGLSIVYKVKAS
jgi:hypothetical protein